MSQINLIPQPLHVEELEGTFNLNSTTIIIASGPATDIAKKFRDWILPSTGLELPIQNQSSKIQSALVFQLDPGRLELATEGYFLEVLPERVTLTASTYSGLRYAAQSLRDLLSPQVYSKVLIPQFHWIIPCVRITDRPRFSWRGSMLDVCRHFMPIEFIYKYLDLLAMHKLNTFHWHLTEDQGWRIEIKKYPLLTEIGSWRKQTLVGHYSSNREAQKYDATPHGGFYSQEEIKQAVAYAARLGINIVPEIEMPGHAQAAITAYPQLGNTGQQLEVSMGWGIHEHVYNVEESTINFLQDVLDEVLSLFPSPFIHVGGDEVPKNEWRNSPHAQKRMRELNLSDENELQSYFIRRMDHYLTGKKRRLIGWDEILEGGLAPNATVMSWRGEAGGIAGAQEGHDVVMAPNTYTYFDYYQSEDHTQEPLAIGGYLPLEKVYSYEPIPNEIPTEKAHHILGTQCQIWTEYIPTPEQVEYMAFPRLCALAEVAWTPRDRKNYESFLNRLKIHQNRLDYLSVNYRKS